MIPSAEHFESHIRVKRQATGSMTDNTISELKELFGDEYKLCAWVA